MYRHLGLIGLIALVGCSGPPPAPTAVTVPPVASTPVKGVGMAYTLHVPNMT